MISEFKGEFRWLSNFEPVEIEIDGIVYPSVEHAYMSAKSIDPQWKKFCRNKNNKAGTVKRESRDIKLIDNWDDRKIMVMLECLKQKFNKEPFKSKLMDTGERFIQEGNNWGDTFWGVYLKTGQGQNHLGRMIMFIRENLTKQNH